MTTPPSCPVCQARAWQFLFNYRDRFWGVPGEYGIFQCDQCALVTYAPALAGEALAASYPATYHAHQPASAAKGIRLLIDDLHLGLRRNAWLKILFWPVLYYKAVCGYTHHLRGLPPGRLLDVGCGNGVFLTRAQRLGFECAGLEPGGHAGPEMERLGIPFYPVPLAELPAGAGRFDYITLHHVFEHLDQPCATLDQLRALLNPGGRVLIRMPRTAQFQWRRWPGYWSHLDVPRHLFLYDENNFERLARGHGFSVRSMRQEILPPHLLWSLKAALTGKLYGERHWLDGRAFSAAILPICSLLVAMGEGDCMAVWLERDGTRNS